MIDGDVPVIDAVVHGYNFSAENLVGDDAVMFVDQLYGAHTKFSPADHPEYTLSYEAWTKFVDPDGIEHAFFAESNTDMMVYHHLPVWGTFRDGGSPIQVGKVMRERNPDRVLIYGGVSPLRDGVFEEVDRLVEEERINGLKLYPIDLVNGELTTIDLGDEDRVFPVLEHAQKRGIKMVGIHKAIPLGRTALDPFRVTDVESAAMAFPGITFEIVHGGFGFLEETAFQVWRFPNVAVNLEGTSALVMNAPMKFAEIIGAFLAMDGEDRIIWASGVITHPKPLVDAFWNLELPEEMCEQYGVPPLSKGLKRKILGENYARLAGLDLDGLTKSWSEDKYAEPRELAEPWSQRSLKVTV